jgi:hypothetical protein
MGDVTFPVNYNKTKIDNMCKGQAKEFGRSLIQNTANIFGLGHAASYKFGQSELESEMINMQKDMEKKKWEITVDLVEKEQKLEENMIILMNDILVRLQEQSSYYKSIFDPQFEDIGILDHFRILLLFNIVFVLVVFINWK